MGLLDSILEKGRAEGLEKGLEKGRAEGRAEGKAEARRDTLEKLLRMKFRTLPVDVPSRIAALSESDLDRALEAVLGASTLDDVLGG